MSNPAPPRPTFAVVAERLGVRRFYQSMARAAGEAALPDSASVSREGLSPSWTPEALERTRQGARYFGLANFYRAMLYVPPAIGLALALPTAGGWAPGVAFVLGLVGALVVFHALCTFLEAYKWTLAGWFGALCGSENNGRPHEAGLGPDVELTQVEAALASLENPRTWAERLMRPTAFDRNWVPRVTLVGLCQKCAVAYIRSTRLSRQERDSGGRVAFLERPSAAEILRFERETRTGEVMHLAAGALNLPGLVVGAGVGAWVWAAWFFVIAFCDVHLALLQRQHRIRVWRALEAYARRCRRSRAADRKPVGAASEI